MDNRFPVESSRFRLLFRFESGRSLVDLQKLDSSGLCHLESLWFEILMRRDTAKINIFIGTRSPLQTLKTERLTPLLTNATSSIYIKKSSILFVFNKTISFRNFTNELFVQSQLNLHQRRSILN
jgi:hypothetical protein